MSLQSSKILYLLVIKILETCPSFQYFNFEADFLEKANPFPKLEYGFLVESTKIENASFPCSTSILEAILKAIVW